MSILIKGATVPETCFECMAIDGLHFIIEELGGHCMMAERIIDPRIFRAREGRLPNCPLVPVPTPHGPLIDADEIIEVQMFDEMYDEWTLKTMSVAEYLAFAADLPPTIIEAEE